jgi:hypothetical protein
MLFLRWCGGRIETVADVYLIYRNRLFGDALCAILATHPEIRLLGASDRLPVDATEIASLIPNVILLEEVDDGASTADVQRILTSPRPCRLITLRLDHDGMHVWTGTWRQTVSPLDLVEAITTAREDTQ